MTDFEPPEIRIAAAGGSQTGRHLAEDPTRRRPTGAGGLVAGVSTALAVA